MEGMITGSSVNIRTSLNLNTRDNIYKNVGYGTKFLVLDDHVTGDEFSGSNKWYKIEYDGKNLYVHSKLATINSRVGKVITDSLTCEEQVTSSTSHMYMTV